MRKGTLLKSIFQCPEKGFGTPVLQAILSQIKCPQAILNKNEERIMKIQRKLKSPKKIITTISLIGN